MKMDLKIEQLNNKYVVVGKGVYQDIDFVNGGYIFTEQRASEIKELLIEQFNAPVIPVKTPEQRIAELEQIMADVIEIVMLGGN
jgi:hypothetical protein